MRPLGVAIQGFKSFKADQSVNFPDGPGFYFLGGENKLHPELGPNGCGKSTLPDALCWCFFGKTTRGVRASGVANWSGENLCSVSTDFERDGVLCNLTRTWNPNALSLQVGNADPRAVTQEEVETFLGCNADTFLATVLVAQHGNWFFDKTPTEKLTLFSSLFGLDAWLDRAVRARDKAKHYASKALEEEQALASVRGRIESNEHSYREATALEASHADALRVETQAAVDRLEDLENQLAAASHALRKALARETEATDAYQAAKGALIAVDDELRDTYQPKARSAMEAIARVNARWSDAKREAARVKAEGAGTCPTCYSEVTTKHVARVVAKLRARARSVEAERDEASKANTEAQRALDKALARRRKAETAYNAAEAARTSAQRAASEARAGVGLLTRQRDQAQEAARTAEARPNPHTEVVARLESTLRRDRGTLALHEADLARYRKREDRYGYWVSGYKDLRLWIMERVLTDLEVAVNNALLDLGLHGWTVTFDVQRETKSGTLSKGFSTFITSPESAEPVAWESWSGGETQRLRIAGAIGLSDLVQAWTGFSCPWEMWDEPTHHLSVEGVQDLLSFFRERARSKHIQVWLVDHRSLAAGDFDGSLLVTLEERGSVFSKIR